MTDNVGHGHLIVGPGPGGSNYAQPLPYTWLSLDRYAQILGITPASFNTATGGTIFPASGDCSDIWFQHDWQAYDRASREGLVLAIYEAEQDLMEAVGYPLAPHWIAEEGHPYPHHHRTELYGGVLNNRYNYKGLHTNLYKVLAGGIRAVTLVQSGIVPTYLDLDGDGLFETARISCATTLTDVREVRVYFHDQSGEREWEIRPCRTKRISAGTFTADFWTWQLIDPNEREDFPTDTALQPISISGNPPSHVVGEVDAYREYNDNTAVSMTVYWEDADVSGYQTQTGNIIVRDPELGWVVPNPATYDSTLADWTADSFTYGVEPDLVKIWYQAGNVDTRYYQSKSFDPLSEFWAKIIAMVATCRLDRAPCACGCANAQAQFDNWRHDLALQEPGHSHGLKFVDLDNPLGTHAGEIMAWNKIRKESILEGVAL